MRGVMEIKFIISESLACIRRARKIEPSTEIELSALRWETYAALQNILDAMAMMIVELGLTKPGTYSELGYVLYKGGLLSHEEAMMVKQIAVTRNMLAHAYRRLSEEDLRKLVQELLPRAEKIAQKLDAALEHKNIDPPHEIKPLTEEELSRLAEIFRRHRVLVAYLFGSRARGGFREESDYDIAVVFHDEGGIMKEVELTIEIADALRMPPDKINLVALKGGEYPLIARILREGITIFEESEHLRKSWEKRIYLNMLRETDLHAIYLRKMNSNR